MDCGEEREGADEGYGDLEVALGEHLDAVLRVDGDEKSCGEETGEEAFFGEEIEAGGGEGGHEEEVEEAPGKGCRAEGGEDELLGEVGAGHVHVDDVAVRVEVVVDQEGDVVDVGRVADEGPAPGGEDEPEKRCEEDAGGEAAVERADLA